MIGAGPVQADLNVTSLPAFGSGGPMTREETEDGEVFSATATLSMRQHDTGEVLWPILSPEDQDTVNRYASAAAFPLTGVANGELMTDDSYGVAETANVEEVLQQAKENLNELFFYSQALRQRAEKNSTEVGPYSAAGLAVSSFADTISSATKQLELLSAFIEADPESGTWEPVPLDL